MPSDHGRPHSLISSWPPPLCSALHSTKGQGASQPYEGASQVSTIQRCAHQTHTKVHALNPYRGACIILAPKTHDLQHFQIHDKTVYMRVLPIFLVASETCECSNEKRVTVGYRGQSLLLIDCDFLFYFLPLCILNLLASEVA